MGLVTFCDFSHSLSEAGGKVYPQKPDFTLDAMTPEASDLVPLEPLFVRKYKLDVNDVQKYAERGIAPQGLFTVIKVSRP
jgi:hypothetical protein